jgi:Lon protease-like protein
MLPLFPLGTVLFPGMVLPLHIFEERYRRLVADLLDGPEPRRFGVIAIREGHEVGVDAVTSLYDVGCVAVVRDVKRHEDGQFDLVTVGTERFRLGEIDRSLPYLRAQVEVMPDDGAVAGSGDEPDYGVESVASAESVTPAETVAVRAAQVAFRDYLEALVQEGGATVRIESLPDEPELLSYVVAASMIIDLPERQSLLASPDAVSRLVAERGLLASESAMLRATTSRPAPDLRHTPYSPN